MCQAAVHKLTNGLIAKMRDIQYGLLRGGGNLNSAWRAQPRFT
jgi:hypothetical protein